MKITDPEVIKNGEQDLIASVQENLDPEMIRDILKERLAMAALSQKGGRIVVHDNDIAFRLDFEVNLSGSLIFDRDGNLIGKEANNGGMEKSHKMAPDSHLPGSSDDLQDETKTDDPVIDFPDDDLDGDDGPSVDLSQDQSNLETKIEHPSLTEEPHREEGMGNLDDDINDLLKESREFWAQKKNS